MSIVDIDISRFDYADPKILEDLYLETPLNVPDDEDFFKIEVNDAYKNNKERIEREEKYKQDARSSMNFDANLREKEANLGRDRSDTKVENEIMNWSDLKEADVDELVQKLSANVIVHSSK